MLTRHVHFGLAHVRAGLAVDPGLYGRLEAAVRRRAAALHGIDGVPAPLQDALTVLAGGSTECRALARGHEAFRDLLETMHFEPREKIGERRLHSDAGRTHLRSAHAEFHVIMDQIAT